MLPNGSLEVLGRKHGVKRWGSAHTAGSDALLTLELFILLGGHKHEAVDSTRKLGEVQQGSQWDEGRWQESPSEWHSGSEQWYSDDVCGVGASGMQVSSNEWGNDTWD